MRIITPNISHLGLRQLLYKVFQCLLHISMIIWTINILVSGKTPQEHLANLSRVLTNLELAGLHLKIKKCLFCQPEVTYLGDIISAETQTFTQQGKSSSKISTDYIENFCKTFWVYKIIMQNFFQI